MKFKVGDVVTAFGNIGEVYHIESNWSSGPLIYVTFGNYNKDSFYSDGRYHKWHNRPSLKLVDKREYKKCPICKDYRHAGKTKKLR